MSIPSSLTGLTSTRTLAFFWAILGCFFVGASPIFVRICTVDPLSSGFFRFFFALPVLFCWMIWEGAQEPEGNPVPRTVKDYLALCSAGLFFAIDTGLWHLSIYETSVVNSTLLNNMTPIFVTLFAWIWFKEKMTALSALGMGMAVVGTCMLVLADGTTAEFHIYGDSLAALSAVFFAGYVLIVKHLRKKFNAPTIMFWSSISCMYALAAIAFTYEKSIVPSTLEGWLPLIGLGVIVHSLGQGLIAYAMRHITATLSSVTMLITPVVSAVVAWIMFNESLTLLKILGGIIILIGIIIARQNEK